MWNSNGTTGSFITLGPDAVSQAAAYVSLFNLQSTNDVRTMTFQLSAAPTGTTGTVFLANNNLSQATATYVQILLDGTSVKSAQRIFIGGVSAGTALAANLAGLRRNIRVSASNLSSGAEVVQFNVLSGSL
jgi:hypothetical protein